MKFPVVASVVSGLALSTIDAFSVRSYALPKSTNMMELSLASATVIPRMLNRSQVFDQMRVPKRCSRLLSQGTDDENEETEGEDSSQAAARNTDENGAKTTLRNILLQINFGFAYIMITLGALLSIGLVLNIFGYGYQIRDGQLRVDTLSQLREEAQFRQEVYKSMKEYRQEQRQLLEKSMQPH